MIPCSRFRDGPLLPVHESEGRDAVGVEHSLAAEGAGLQPGANTYMNGQRSAGTGYMLDGTDHHDAILSIIFRD